MKQLLEDYQRKLKTINKMIDDLVGKSDSSANEAYIRLSTKKECYTTFITELEREMKSEFKENGIIPVKENELVLVGVDTKEPLIIPISLKDQLVDYELVFNNWNNWLYFEHDADEIIKIKNACK